MIQKPFGWFYKGRFHHFDPSDWASPEFPVVALYAPRKPLTEGQINEGAIAEGAHNADFWAGVRFAETAHGIKENI
jgi:hypothetical protein